MPSPVKLLGEIQSIDLEIAAIRKKEEEFRAQIESVGKEREASEEKIELIKGEIEALGAEDRDLEEKLRLNEEKLVRDGEKLPAIKRDRELKALTKEISNIEKIMKLHEMERLSLQGKITAKGAEVESVEAERDEIVRRLEVLSGELDNNLKQWEEETEQSQSKRNAVAKELMPSLLKRYETIKSRRGGVGVVKARNETCQGCYMQLPPQTYLLLVKGALPGVDDGEIISCPNCHRILYCEDSSQPSNQSGAV